MPPGLALARDLHRLEHIEAREPEAAADREDQREEPADPLRFAAAPALTVIGSIRPRTNRLTAAEVGFDGLGDGKSRRPTDPRNR